MTLITILIAAVLACWLWPSILHTGAPRNLDYETRLLKVEFYGYLVIIIVSVLLGVLA